MELKLSERINNPDEDQSARAASRARALRAKHAHATIRESKRNVTMRVVRAVSFKMEELRAAPRRERRASETRGAIAS